MMILVKKKWPKKIPLEKARYYSELFILNIDGKFWKIKKKTVIKPPEKKSDYINIIKKHS